MAFACARFGITREDSDEEACCPVWLDEVTKRLNQLDRCTICGTFMAAPVWNVVTRRPLYPVLTRCCSKRCRMQAAGVRNLGDLVPPSDSGNGNNNATSDDGEGGCTDQIILP
ncbi:hypothetical protein EV182_006378 [Spiromyces aspiralis]|uniref:Uncharacterized protein n=1 Tax=Spiromyces aspiralis TaxID=68401 RepID=A0ACC1HLB1_9FUNG|nr:hypothetical protein EV182_006378 [Spiromyces aspiralis]